MALYGPEVWDGYITAMSALFDAHPIKGGPHKQRRLRQRRHQTLVNAACHSYWWHYEWPDLQVPDEEVMALISLFFPDSQPALSRSKILDGTITTHKLTMPRKTKFLTTT